MSNICWFQILDVKDFLLFFVTYILCHTEEAIHRLKLKALENLWWHFFTIFFFFLLLLCEYFKVN